MRRITMALALVAATLTAPTTAGAFTDEELRSRELQSKWDSKTPAEQRRERVRTMEGWDPENPPILDALGLPRCADQAVVAAAKQAMEDNPRAYLQVRVFDVADVRERGAMDGMGGPKRACLASMFTNAGRRLVFYSVEWMNQAERRFTDGLQYPMVDLFTGGIILPLMLINAAAAWCLLSLNAPSAFLETWSNALERQRSS